MTTIIDIAPALISPSPHNHRKKFTGLEELADSLVDKGMICPITVRPNGSPGTYELVAGERRWRAAKIAKLETVPAILRELSDKEVIEIQLIENVQRVDVHPMEEASGYAELIEKHGYTPEMICSKTGKSRTAVYNRLKLNKLAPVARKAFLDDKFNASIAEMIARLPVKDLQEQATKDILRGREVRKWDIDDLGIDADDRVSPPREGIEPIEDEEVVPLSFREAQLMLQRRYMLRLELAPFAIEDATLLPKIGACTTCVHRTGNQPDLFNDVGSADVCTNPPCYDAKKKADWDRRAEIAATEGKIVLAAAEAEHVFRHDRLNYGSPYVDLKEEADWEFQPKSGKKKTWEQVLGKDTPQIILGRDEGGAAHEIVEKKAALARLGAAGKLPKELVKQQGHDRPFAKKQNEALRMRRKTAEYAIETIVGANGRDLEEERWLAYCVIRQASPEAQLATCNRRGVTVEKGAGLNGLTAQTLHLLAFAKEMEDAEELHGLVRELLAWESAATLNNSGWGMNITAAAKVWKVDLPKLLTKTTAEAKASAKDATKAKSKASKKGSKS